MRVQSTLEERFWARVNKDGPVQKHFAEIGPCWLWMEPKTRYGYGQVFAHGRNWRAHRVAYILTNGAPPADKPFVLHHCDNPICVRPSHLFAGTQADNVSDAVGKNRHVRFTAPWWKRVSY